MERRTVPQGDGRRFCPERAWHGAGRRRGRESALRCSQAGRPGHLVRRPFPRTRFVAGFIGRTNFLEGTLAGGEIGFPGLALEAGRFPEVAKLGRRVVFSVRPQSIRLSRAAGGFRGRIESLAANRPTPGRPYPRGTMSKLPLSRFKVIDLTRVRAGPTCVRQLADWGAEVIKVEAAEGDAGLGREQNVPDCPNWQ